MSLLKYFKRDASSNGEGEARKTEGEVVTYAKNEVNNISKFPKQLNSTTNRKLQLL